MIDPEDSLEQASPEYRKMRGGLRQAWDDGERNPDNVHAAAPTWDKLRGEVRQAGPQYNPDSTYVINPVTRKLVRIVEDEVPEGRYFFSDQN